jgi:hypothetical protein
MRSHAIETGSGRHTNSKGIFIRILEALRLSRRREPTQAIRRYHHLTIVTPDTASARDEASVDKNINEVSTTVSSRIREIRNGRKQLT